MFRKITIALLASTLIATPVLAQSTVPAPKAPASQPVKATAATTVKTTASAVKPGFMQVGKVSKVKKHKVKKLKIAKHVKMTKHVKHAPKIKHPVHATTKPVMPSPHN